MILIFYHKRRKTKRKKILIFGRDGGILLDNAKYALISIKRDLSAQCEIIFVSSNKSTIDICQKFGVNTCQPNLHLKNIIHFLTADVVVVDSIEWCKNGKYHFLKGAHIIQLWHGIPLKEIELKKAHTETANKFYKLAYNIYWAVCGRFPSVDTLISTSDFSSELLSACIPNKKVVPIGYPRNDAILSNNISDDFFINVDLVSKKIIDFAHNDNTRIFLYCPTFRDNRKNPFSEKLERLSRVNIFLKNNNIIIAVKLHPWISDYSYNLNSSNIIFINPLSDIYPILSSFDGLITDYSSIYFDFLLTEKPIYFFPYDLSNYQSNEREFLLEYNNYTPGPKLFNIKSLLRALVSNKEKLSTDNIDKILLLKRLMHKHSDSNSGRRLTSYITSLLNSE